MAVIGDPLTVHHKYLFVVEIEGVESARFQSCTGLEFEIATVAISQGGDLTPEKNPGRVTFSKITLARGATSDLDLHQWGLDGANAATNSGLTGNAPKRDIAIVQLDRDKTELQRFNVFGAFITKYMTGGWDNEADEYRIESAELDFHHFTPG